MPSRSVLLACALLGVGFVGSFGCSSGDASVDQPGQARESEALRGTSPLVPEFLRVSKQTGVPVEYLVGVAYEQSRFVNNRKENSAWGGRGMMQLVPGQSLLRASRLSGLTEDELGADAAANLLGSALVLAELNTQYGSWDRALAAYGPGELDPEAGLAFARRVLALAEGGVRGSDDQGLSVVLDGAYADGESLGQQSSALRPDYSGANWVGPACGGNYSAASRGPAQITDVVIHTCQGGFSGCWGWLKNCASGVSAHYVVSSAGEVVQLVEENDVAYHDGCFNSNSVGIEHEGFIDDPNRWFTDAMYCSSAKLVRSICDRNNIPCDRAHVRGHAETPDCSDHTDPGPGWNWKKFMEYVDCGCGGCCNAATETCNGKDDNCNGDIDEGDVCEVELLNNEVGAYAPPSSTDVNGDGAADVCGRGMSGVWCHFAVAGGWSDKTPTAPAWSDQGGWDDVSNFATFRMGDVNGDGFADLCARSNSGVECTLGSSVGLAAAGSGTWSAGFGDAAGWKDPRYYTTLRLADVNADGREDLCARSAAGFDCYLSDGLKFDVAFPGPRLSDETGWGSAKNYGTIRTGDVNGDGRADVCARANAGMRCYLAGEQGFESDSIAGPEWSNAQGWDLISAWSSIRLADVSGDGRADLCGRNAEGLSCALSTGDGFEPVRLVAAYTDVTGWADPSNYSTLRVGDVDGDGAQDLCIRANAGVVCHALHDGEFVRITGPEWSDDAEWQGAAYFHSFSLADVNADGMADWCGRGVTGWRCALSDGAGFSGEWALDEFTSAGGWDALKYRATLLSAGPPPATPSCQEAEECNGLDDDCDGQIDEDCAGVGGAAGAAAGGASGAAGAAGAAGAGSLSAQGVATRDGGCGCSVPGTDTSRSGSRLAWAFPLLVLSLCRRRRRAAA